MRNRGKRLAPQPYAGLGRLCLPGRITEASGRAFGTNNVHVYTNGSTETIASDESWKYAESRVRFSEIYDGEVYDAAFETGFCAVHAVSLTARGIR